MTPSSGNHRLRTSLLTVNGCERACLELLVANNPTYDQKLHEKESRRVCCLVQNDTVELEIRSCPADLYRGCLRHYYVRIGNVVEIHPGTRERISLIGDNETTLHDGDVCEKQYFLCVDCANKVLSTLWLRCRRFNLLWHNCDQMLGQSIQTRIIVTVLLVSLPYILLRDTIGLFVVFLTVICLLAFSSWYNYDRVYGIREKNNRHVCCHLSSSLVPPPLPRPMDNSNE